MCFNNYSNLQYMLSICMSHVCVHPVQAICIYGSAFQWVDVPFLVNLKLTIIGISIHNVRTCCG